MPSFQGNGFLGLGDKHIELHIQWDLNSIMVSLWRNLEKNSDSSRNPINQTTASSKVELVC